MKNIILPLIISIMSFSAFAEDKIKYITQILEPTGGRIEKPESWFYSEAHGGASYSWILSEENPNDGTYNTGVRIQLIPGIKAGTGDSPEQFAKNFIVKKKKVAQVLSECEKTKVSIFYRVCLETLEIATEGTKVKSHINYSIFWDNKIDMFLIVTAGTSVDLWDEKKDIFKKMAAFEFIDMKRFKESNSSDK